MKIWVSPYELEPHEILGGVHHSRKGVLLKFETVGGLIRYSLYQPIESLGDVPLDVFVENLKKKSEVVDLDILNKVKKVSISLEDVSRYKNQKVGVYYSSPSVASFLEEAQDIEKMNFKTVKIKVSKISEIENSLSLLSELPFDYIFDFNTKASPSEFASMTKETQSFFKTRVLYVEDPYKEKLKFSYAKLASDFNDYEGFEDVVVLKPTGFNHDMKNSNGKDVVVTTYLDHPLGQIIAALWAVKYKEESECPQGQNLGKLRNECGLYSHTYYKPHKYSELFKREPFIHLSALDGFLKLLDQEDWSRV